LSLSEVPPLQVPLSHQTDIAGFHGEATRLLAQGVPPETVRWSAADPREVGEESVDDERTTIRSRAARAIIPQSFVRMSELVVLHRDPRRFDLLYRSLWRLVFEPELRHDRGDADLSHLRQMAQSVRRDIQKMRNRLVFRPLQVNGATAHAAWYEPTHLVTETVAVALTRQERATPWMVLTPDRCLHWDGKRLLGAPGLRQSLRTRPGDAEWQEAIAALPWN
jgi:probable DNA metabolism protein